MAQQVYNTGAPAGAEVVASLVAPNSAGTPGSKGT